MTEINTNKNAFEASNQDPMNDFSHITYNAHVTRRNREVVDFKRYRVKNNTELTNLMKMYRIQGYNDKYGSNPQGI